MFLLVPFETVLRLPDIVAMLGQNACLLFFLCCMLLLFLISLCLITFPVLCALDWVAASCIVVGLDSGDEEGGGAAKTNLQNLQSSSSSSASEDEGGTEGASSMFLLSSLSITIVLLIDCTHSFFGFVRDAFRFWLVMFRLLSDSLALDLFVLSSVSCVCLFSSGGYAHPFLHWFAGYSFVSLHSPLVHVLLFLSVSLCFSVFFSSCSFNCVDCSSCCGFSDTVGSWCRTLQNTCVGFMRCLLLLGSFLPRLFCSGLLVSIEFDSWVLWWPLPSSVHTLIGSDSEYDITLSFESSILCWQSF